MTNASDLSIKHILKSPVPFSQLAFYYFIQLK